jgi:AcrR family transcriptional regulator
MKDDNATRLQILRKAHELFRTHGFSKVTTDDLATELGISKKTLYHYFSSKEELLRESVYLMRDEMAAAVERVADDREMDVVEKFKLMLTTVGTKLATMRRPFFEDIRRKAPDLWRELEDFRRDRILKTFDRLISEGSRKGMLRKRIDPHIFVLMFYAVVQNILNPDVMSQLSQSPDEAFTMITTVLIEGVLSDEAKAKFYAIEKQEKSPTPRAKRSKG